MSECRRAKQRALSHATEQRLVSQAAGCPHSVTSISRESAQNQDQSPLRRSSAAAIRVERRYRLLLHRCSIRFDGELLSAMRRWLAGEGREDARTSGPTERGAAADGRVAPECTPPLSHSLHSFLSLFLPLFFFFFAFATKPGRCAQKIEKERHTCCNAVMIVYVVNVIAV